MNEYKKIKELIEKNEKNIEELSGIIKILESKDLQKENDTLKQSIAYLKKNNEELKIAIKKYKEENYNLKEKLKIDVFNSRKDYLLKSANNLNILFEDTKQSDFNTIRRIEKKYYKSFINIEKIIHNKSLDEEVELEEKLGELNKILNEKVKIVEEEEAKEIYLLKQKINKEYDNLANDNVSDESLEKIPTPTNIEMKIGNNILNVLGVLLILLGVIFGLQYAFTNILKSNELKSALGFLLGVIFLVIGEVLQKKEKNIFGVGLTAGGLSILFATTGLSYFVLEVLGMYPALIVSILISLVAFIMAIRYDSKLIVIFAYLGSYFPLFAIDFDSKVMVYSALIYFIVINVFTLLVSIYKKWRFIVALSFFFHMITSIFVLLSAPNNISVTLVVIYLILSLIMYIGIILSNNFINKTKITNMEIIVLYINTIIYTSGVFLSIEYFSNETFKYFGFVVIGFFIMYFILTNLAKKLFSHDKRVVILFYLITFTFSLLIIPVQFGLNYAFIGWLTQGVGLIIFGLVTDEKSFINLGGIVLAFSGAMLLKSVEDNYYYLGAYAFKAYHKIFIQDFSVFTISLNLILSLYLSLDSKFNVLFKNKSYDKEKRTLVYKSIKAIVLPLNLIFINIIVKEVLYYNKINIHPELLVLATIVVTIIYFAYEFAFKYFEKLNDTYGKIIRGVINFIVTINLITLNLEISLDFKYGALYLGIIIILNFISVFNIFKLLMKNIKSITEGIAHFVSSLYFLLLLFVLIKNLYALNIYSLTVSLIIMVASFVWILYGFVRNIKFIRTFGLFVAILSTAKLFLIDLPFLNAGIKILSYFAFGGVLIAISAVYQYFDKKI